MTGGERAFWIVFTIVMVGCMIWAGVLFTIHPIFTLFP